MVAQAGGDWRRPALKSCRARALFLVHLAPAVHGWRWRLLLAVAPVLRPLAFLAGAAVYATLIVATWRF